MWLFTGGHPAVFWCSVRSTRSMYSSTPTESPAIIGRGMSHGITPTGAQPPALLASRGCCQRVS